MRPLPRAPAPLTTATARLLRRPSLSRYGGGALVGGGGAAVTAAAGARSSSSSSSPSASPSSPPAVVPAGLAGTWTCRERHGVDDVMRVWGLPAVARATAKQIRGVVIGVVEGEEEQAAAAGEGDRATPVQQHLTIRYLCPVPQFDVREKVPLGQHGRLVSTRLRRRDLKPGGCEAHAEASPCGRRVAVRTAWEGCELEEVYELGEGDDALVLKTTLRCRSSGEARAAQVYARDKRSH